MSPEVWENQDKLFSYGDWLAEQNEATDLGFIATVNDANSLSVKLLWEEDRLDAAGFYKEEAEARGLNVSVIPRKYSLQELESTAERLMDDAAALEDSGFQVDTVTGLQEALQNSECNRLNPTPRIPGMSPKHEKVEAFAKNGSSYTTFFERPRRCSILPSPHQTSRHSQA
ncbi:hypothetical protein [Glutamicibacter protophormiae]|uniref:hypothetical protein n=1 Tax=Glutamicibacter protophormiae TaxID=37930 RepID=UPI00195E4A4E|nr:hypothetical protein [Glutamicibacter protophormiae]QRQ77128.1 hypothetical protein JQN66_09090 [Glutamicibacter protophormiae]